MKKTLVLLTAATLAIVGCKQRSDVNESAGAEKDRVESQANAQKESLDQQKKQISEQAGAQKKAIEAQADAQKAQLDAEKKQIEAQEKAAKAEAEAKEEQAKAQAKAQEAQADAQKDQAQAQAKADQAQAEAQTNVNEAAGATTTTEKDRDLETRLRTSLFGDKATTDQEIKITVRDGKVTLSGTVKSEQEKQEWEQKAQSTTGVTAVDNQLKVKE